jgi:hypothetical protein
MVNRRTAEVGENPLGSFLELVGIASPQPYEKRTRDAEDGIPTE